MEDPADVEGAVREALEHRVPALLDVLVNPDEPPMPPKIHYEQPNGFAEAFLRGEPRRATIASTLFKDKLDQLLD